MSELTDARLIELFDELAGSGRTDYTADILRRTAATRQRSAWEHPARWLPQHLIPRRPWLPSPPSRSLPLLVALGLLLAVVVALAVGSRRLPAPFGPTANGTIAYASDGEIWVATGPDAHRSVLISGPESDNIPIFSPQGNRLAFLRHPDPTGTVGEFYLMVADADGGDVRQVSGPLAGLNGIAWAPDGERIAFGHTVDGASRIVLYPIDGRPASILDVGIPAEWPAWRPPDGRQIAFLGLVDGIWTLHIADADGSNVRNLGILSGPPAWNAQGSALASDTVVGGPEGEGRPRIQLVRIDEVGGLLDSTELEFDERNDREVRATWSPDSSWLAFMRVRDGRSALAVGAPDGSAYREIGPETGPPDAAMRSDWLWAPDGRTVLLTYDDGPSWILAPSGEPPRRATFGTGAFSSWQRIAP